MNHDAGSTSDDGFLMERRSLSSLNKDTIGRYRMRFANLNEKHVWANIPDEEFLIKIGAASLNNVDNVVYPTAAGLLMFGNEYEIIKELNEYFLDYREPFDASGVRWVDRVISSSGDWSGNLYDFYFRVQDRLTSSLKIPFVLKNGQDRIDDKRIHEAVREALANALIHTDYFKTRGINIVKRENEIIFSNPGSLRISIQEAMAGGISDTRNVLIMRMFSLVGIGEGTGSGLAKIRTVWNEYGYKEPILTEQFNPDRITLKLSFENDNVTTNVTTKSGMKLTSSLVRQKKQ
jgi:predicted HTH transcriptional regulator